MIPATFCMGWVCQNRPTMLRMGLRGVGIQRNICCATRDVEHNDHIAAGMPMPTVSHMTLSEFSQKGIQHRHSYRLRCKDWLSTVIVNRLDLFDPCQRVIGNSEANFDTILEQIAENMQA